MTRCRLDVDPEGWTVHPRTRQTRKEPTMPTYISPSLPGMIRNLWKSDPSERSVRTALNLAGDLIQELIDLRDQPAADHQEPPNADDPTDAEVRAAAEELDGHSWMTDPDEGSLCTCGEVLAPSLEYAGDAYRSHIARAALVAARRKQ